MRKRNENFMPVFPKRGEIWFADIGGVVGKRPVLILQNNLGNHYSQTVVCATITSSLKRLDLATHIVLPKRSGLPKDSMIKAEHIFTLKKRKLGDRMCMATREEMERVEKALFTELGISMPVPASVLKRRKEVKGNVQSVVC